jgi:hypothetical protein
MRERRGGWGPVMLGVGGGGGGGGARALTDFRGFDSGGNWTLCPFGIIASE